VNWLVEANVLEKRTISIFRAEVMMLGFPASGDSTLLRNVGFYQPVHMAPKSRRTSFSNAGCLHFQDGRI
jgi:hypothetical protein